MSRFLSSYRRLSRKVQNLERQHLSGDVGPSLAEFSVSGRLPEQPWLKDAVKWHLAVAAAMAQTMPGLPPEDTGQESC
jgi:hypothetical protein